MGSPLVGLVRDVAALFLPRCCAGCDRPLMRSERAICLACTADLPRTQELGDPLGPVERVFHGRLRLVAAGAFLQFRPGGTVQRMLHRLKYNGDEEVGLELGRHMAEDALRSGRFATVDAFLAVPLHRRKQRQRGYNQSQVLVEGMRERWPLPSLHTELVRRVHTGSQTRRGRMDRWLNVKEAFALRDPDRLRNKHVLIVDDVVTTGATIEGCARLLENVAGVRISVLTCAGA